MDGEINIPSVDEVVGSIGADVDNDGSNGGTGSAVAGEGVVVSGLPAIPSSAKICSDDNGCRAKSTYLLLYRYRAWCRALSKSAELSCS